MAAAALDLRKWHWPREPTKATWIQRLLLLVIVLICGFILNKVLVFSVLFISLWKAWAQFLGWSQTPVCCVFQVQKTFKLSKL
ncbi:triggering receptor expressed on myeloid cells 3-like isoform X2 [Mirounga angustirostris]|uniref:triggering receptor expressed on myeloid cells 3-like isoform X2 n=1 Tax=Mirounga angustirostris TaxID=9716 RepID=UPI00313B7FAE